MENLTFGSKDLTLLAQFGAVMILSLMGYGALTLFLGAIVRRPVVVGVIFIYGWQTIALYVPGLIDFLTIRKYTDIMMPKLAAVSASEKMQTVLGEFQKQVYLASAGKAALILLVISALLLGLTVLTVRFRQYATSHAVGG